MPLMMLKSMERLFSSKRHHITLSNLRLLSDEVCIEWNKDEKSTDTKPTPNTDSPNPRVLLSVVCDGADGGNSVILSSAPNSYVFNFGEGFQMSQSAYGKATKSGFKDQHMFVTHASWKNVGGILGYLQSHRNGELRHTLHGPVYYKELLNSLKRTTTLYLSMVHEVKLQMMRQKFTYFEDSQIRIDYVKLTGETMNRFGVRSPKFANAYIIKPKRCETIDQAYMSAEKLVDLGLKWGPETEALTRGESVTLDSGKVITIKDVLQDDQPIYKTGSIVVLECPSEVYFDSMMSAQELIDLPSDPDWAPDVIIHMSPVHIVKDKRYKKFMKRFGEQTTHVMLNEDSEGRFCPHYHKYRKALTSYNKYMFPALKHKTDPMSYVLPSPGSITQGLVGLQYSYRQKKWYTLRPRDFDIAIPIKTDIAHKKNKHPKQPMNKPATDYPEIVFLGTGSSMPHLARNVLSILVQMRKDEYMMLDCGESTLRQMHKLYGRQTKYVLRKLKGVFISHKHYDHLGGLPAILDAWGKATEGIEPAPIINILIPIEMKEMLYMYVSVLSGLNAERINVMFHNPLFAFDRSRQTVTPQAQELMDQMKKNLNLTEYLPVMVPHQKWFRSYGIVMTHEDGWKLVFTGDTVAKCPNLIRLGKDCDILIHEATYPDYKQYEAQKAGHSTHGEAIANGIQMGAKYTILTHFSAKYEGSAYNTKTSGVSFDFMKFRPSQAEALSAMDLRMNNYNRHHSISEDGKEINPNKMTEEEHFVFG